MNNKNYDCSLNWCSQTAEREFIFFIAEEAASYR